MDGPILCDKIVRRYGCMNRVDRPDGRGVLIPKLNEEGRSSSFCLLYEFAGRT